MRTKFCVEPQGTKLMRIVFIVVVACSVGLILACEVQSDMAKRGVEKYVSTPTPVPSPQPTEEPIDPADSVNIDTSKNGPNISIDSPKGSARANCSAYNRVTINAFDKKIDVSGGCSQLMVNGDGNVVKIAATSEIVLNGHKNTITYSKFLNGKRPIITNNGRDNTIERSVTPEEATK